MRKRGRVLWTVGGRYTADLDGTEVVCALRGRLKLSQKDLGQVAVGDEVWLGFDERNTPAIVDVLPRRSELAKRSAQGERRQIIAANLDQLAAIFSVARPEPNFVLLDRLLLVAELNGIAPFIVANKIDLTGPQHAREVFAVYEMIGYPVLYSSARCREGIRALADRLKDRITALVGPSGAGKSTLLNAIQPELGLRVGELSRRLGRGRHTTVASSLHRLDMGGYVADTPGIQRLRLWELPEGPLDLAFREFRRHRDACRFSDCRHLQEPECAVRDAVERGEIAESRYRSYVEILAEKEAARPY